MSPNDTWKAIDRIDELNKCNMEEDLEYKLICPMYYADVHCGGDLEFVNSGGTCLGTLNGIDCNNHAEFFVCKRCGVRLYRTYQWKIWKENE